MVNHGSMTHQNTIIEFVEELKEQGYHAINLHGKAPDGIAYKDGKLYAIEVLGLGSIPKHI